MTTTHIKIKGMTCLNCVTHIQKALEAVPGVTDADVIQGEGARVVHEGASDEQLLRAIRAAGDYEAEIQPGSREGGAALGILLVALLLVGTHSSPAADHENLEEGLPAEIEDAYPIGLYGREIQSVLRYERTDDDKDRVIIDPRIEFGFAPNWQGKISVPFYLGSADKTDSGNVGLEAFYNFNTEGVALPAFALSTRADLPTGRDSAGIDTTVKAILTKSITKTGLDRIHVNLAWKHNAGARHEQREDLYRAMLGYSRRINADTVFVADFVREQEIERKKEANIFEAGVRRQITPLSLITFGLGTGVGDDSPEFRATIGFQKSF